MQYQNEKNMRTIKFRGLRTDGKGWVYGYYLTQNGIGVDGSSDVDIHFILDSFGTQIIIPETVGQFTGLTDKNGVDIYDGDKLGNQHNIVEWGNDGWCINGDRPLYIFVKNNEVIGNIHQN